MLLFVDRRNGFMEAFEHVLGRYRKAPPSKAAISACLMAYATSIGLGRMADISNLTYQELSTTAGNCPPRRSPGSTRWPIASAYFRRFGPRTPLLAAGDVEWVRGVMAGHDYPHAVVAQAWLDAENVAEVLAAHAATGVVRSVRHKPTATHSPHMPAPCPRGSMSETGWRDGYALLAGHGIDFDLQVVHWHLPEAARLARDFPRTTIIVNHAGLPADRSAEGLAAWRRSLECIAAEPNAALKISGIGQPGRPWTVESNRQVVLDCIAVYGVERCMFASNFPVDRLGRSFTDIYQGFSRITVNLGEDARRALFHDNAVRYYRL